MRCGWGAMSMTRWSQCARRRVITSGGLNGSDRRRLSANIRPVGCGHLLEEFFASSWLEYDDYTPEVVPVT